MTIICSVGVCRHCAGRIEQRPFHGDPAVLFWRGRDPDGCVTLRCPARAEVCLTCAGSGDHAEHPARACPDCTGRSVVPTGDHEPLPEHDAIAALEPFERHSIGPRRTGGLYWRATTRTTFRVEGVLTGEAARHEIPWSDHAIVEVDVDVEFAPIRRVHCTAWHIDRPGTGDQVVAFPLDSGDPYLTDIERCAQLCEAGGDRESAAVWRDGAVQFLTGATGCHNWGAAKRMLAEHEAFAAVHPHPIRNVVLISRAPRRAGHDHVGHPAERGDTYELRVNGEPIGGTYWDSGAAAGAPRHWASWGPAGTSPEHLTREDAEQVQLVAYRRQVLGAQAPFAVYCCRDWHQGPVNIRITRAEITVLCSLGHLVTTQPAATAATDFKARISEHVTALRCGKPDGLWVARCWRGRNSAADDPAAAQAVQASA